MLTQIPGYIELYESGRLEEIISFFKGKIFKCDICPRNCNVNRKNQKGMCRQTDKTKLTNVVLHTGEEPPLVEGSGAGAVFFSGCSMKCVYCQNFAFSQLENGKNISVEELKNEFLILQEKGASNIDLISPTPHIPFFLEAVKLGIPEGLRLPIVYNTSSYEKVETLRMLEGFVDIYLADIRYTEDRIGERYSKVPDYWTAAKKAIREMFRQVGSKGLIIRHLVLPEGLSGTKEALEFVSEELSYNVPVSLMSQYFPVFGARDYPEINRKILLSEYEEAKKLLYEHNLYNGWVQELSL